MKPDWYKILRLAAEEGARHAWRQLVEENTAKAAKKLSSDYAGDIFADEFMNALEGYVLWEDLP